MKDEYVKFGTAKLLKEKGFNWECIGYYANDEPEEVYYSLLGETNSTWEPRCCSAPTVQAAIDWVETKGYWIIYRPLNYDSGVDTYIYTANDDKEWYAVINFVTHTKYEGLNKALEYVLKNLI